MVNERGNFAAEERAASGEKPLPDHNRFNNPTSANRRQIWVPADQGSK